MTGRVMAILPALADADAAPTPCPKPGDIVAVTGRDRQRYRVLNPCDSRGQAEDTQMSGPCCQPMTLAEPMDAAEPRAEWFPTAFLTIVKTTP